MQSLIEPAIACLLAISAVTAQHTPEWAATTRLGTALSNSFAGVAVDSRGRSFVAATTGPSTNTDISIVARGPDGSVLWSRTYDGPNNGVDQARGITLDSRRSVVWITGNAAGSRRTGDVILLGFDMRNGALRHVGRDNAALSEHGGSVVTDAAGNVYVAGGTVGDGLDVLILKFDPVGKRLWRRTWDGAASGPFSQDVQRGIAIDPNGNVIVLIHGVSAFQQPDYVVHKLATNGTTLWTKSWGGRGGDYPEEMQINGAGDIFVTGIGIKGSNQLGTIRLRGHDGSLMWQAYDTLGFHNSSVGLSLDSKGGVYILGSIDPDGDRSNANHDIYLVKRDARTGARAWTFRFGANCRGCFDRASDVVVDRQDNVYLAAFSSNPPYSRQVLTFVLDARTGTARERRPMLGTLQPNVGSGQLRFDGRDDLFNASQSRNPNTGATFASIFKQTNASRYRLDIGDLIGGRVASLDVRNATPRAFQIVTLSAAGTGTLPVPPLGVTLGLSNPLLLAVGVADPAGRYSLRLPLPASSGRLPLWFQIVETGRTTPVIARTLQ